VYNANSKFQLIQNTIYNWLQDYYGLYKLKDKPKIDQIWIKIQ